jgi:hypothetical protein
LNFFHKFLGDLVSNGENLEFFRLSAGENTKFLDKAQKGFFGVFIPVQNSPLLGIMDFRKYFEAAFGTWFYL